MSDIEKMKEIITDLQFSVEKLAHENENLKNVVGPLIEPLGKIYDVEKTIQHISKEFYKSLKNNLNYMKDEYDEVRESIENLKKAEKKKIPFFATLLVVATTSAVITTTFFLALDWAGVDCVNFFINLYHHF